MTYHRTTGKGGTVNRSRDPRPVNKSKSTVAGHTKRPSKGVRKHADRNVPRG